MAKVGNIMTRHNGANVAVGDIYDQKIFSTSGNVFDETPDTDAVVFSHATADGNFVDDAGATDTMITPASQTVEFHSVGGRSIPFIRCESSSRIYITFPSFSTSAGITIDGIFYYYNNVSTRTQRIFELLNGSTSNYLMNLQAFGTSHWMARGTSTLAFSLSSDVFDSPFHLAVSYSAPSWFIFVNGELKQSYSQTKTVNSNRITVGNTAGGTNSDISCAFLRVRNRCVWTADFTPFSATLPSVAVRHNNTTYYAPLTTTANRPCIAVRHNNQTYYTVRS